MLKKLAICLAAAAVTALTGCVSSPAGLAPSTIPITSKDRYVITKRGISESTSTTYLFGVLPLGFAPSAYDLIQTIKEKYNSDGIINVAAENRYNFFLLVTVEKTIISGDVIKLSQLGGADVD